MPRFGAHLSVTPFAVPPPGRGSRGRRDKRGKEAAPGATVSGPLAALERARALKCDCVQMFLRPNRQWNAPKLTAEEIDAFRAAAFGAAEGETIRPIVSHAAYLINIAGPPGVQAVGGSAGPPGQRRDVRARSIRALKDELRRADLLGVPYVVLHPGNHMGQGEEAGLRRVVEALDEALDESADSPVTVLIETTAGQGTGLGHRLEHLAWILTHAAHGKRLGVCADTCHMFAAGYDFRTPAACEATLREIDRTVGLERLAVWHLNDCLKELGSRVDRHTHIGRGQIGRQGFRLLVTDSRFADRAMIIETPKEDSRGRAMDPVNLRLLRRLACSRAQ